MGGLVEHLVFGSKKKSLKKTKKKGERLEMDRVANDTVCSAKSCL